MKFNLLLIGTLVLLFSFEHKPLTWVAIGDSITYLNDHLKETDNKVTKGYMTLVKEQLPHINYINQGHNGWTAVRIAESIDKLGLLKADVYSIFLGTNDWWRGLPLGQLSDYKNNTGTGTVHGAFRVIVNKLRSLNPDAKIILITPMQRVDFIHYSNMKNHAWGSYKEKNGQWLEQFANAVDSIGQFEHLAVVDLYHTKKLSHKHLIHFKRLKDPATGLYRDYKWPDFKDIPFNPETDNYPYPKESIDMTYDGLHPSDAGYRVIAKKLKKVLKTAER